MLRELAVIGVASALLSQAPQQAPAAPPPGTDIYELDVTPAGGPAQGAGVAGAPRVVSAERGYENQPFYTPDGKAILFTANRDGKQMDIYEFDRAGRRARQLVSTPEGEYSATVTPDGAGFSVIRMEADRTQRLWRFERDGSKPRLLLTDIKPVGYHAWIDADQLALFILGQPATLQRARLSTGKADVVAQDIGRSLHRIPNTRFISFVHREAGESWVKQYDATTGAVTPLVKTVTGSSERDCAWLPDGTLLMSAGTKVMAWTRGQEGWRELVDVSAHELGPVTRMAASPDGKALAIVVAERWGPRASRARCSL